MRDLYHKRVSDVRFLIPVLTGLSKKEVVSALPKLIKLNPVVVKEVFNRLLGAQEVEGSYVSPLTPAELLIALHNIDPLKSDMKTSIKGICIWYYFGKLILRREYSSIGNFYIGMMSLKRSPVQYKFESNTFVK